MLRSLVVIVLALAASPAANAACVIDRLRPTGTLPTMMMGQTFQFVATNDCALLHFSVNGNRFSRVPTMGAAAGPGAHWYEAALSATEWTSATGREVTVFRWTVWARDTTSPRTIVEVDQRNELDTDRDGWTRTEGDVGRCDDFADRNPDAIEICDNGIDEDCDGVDECVLDLGEADATVYGSVRMGSMGSSLAIADVDGDGIGDLLSGAPDSVDGSGRAYVSFGPVSGTVVAGDDVTIAPDDGQALGESLAGGDADGDGFGDVLIGSFSWTRANETTVRLLLGPISGEVSTAMQDLELSTGRRLEHHLGYHLEITPDVDGDGGSDLIVTAPYASSHDGAVYVVPGTTTGSVQAEDVATYVFRGPSGLPDYLGMDAIAVEDTDGDGIRELAMADWGAVYVVAGAIPSGAYDVGTIATATIGLTNYAWADSLDARYLANVDADHDGYGDLVVGDPDDSFDEGIVSLLLGPLSGSLDVVDDAAASWSGDLVGDLVSAGDCNGDGEADYVFSGRDDVYLAVGPAAGVVEVDTLPSFETMWPPSIQGDLLFAPDWSGDGVQEIVLGVVNTRTDAGVKTGAAHVYYSDRF